LIKLFIRHSSSSAEPTLTVSAPPARVNKAWEEIPDPGDKCPYCVEQLKKKPEARTKCPHCGKYIYVKRGKPVTVEQAEAIETEWTRMLTEEANNKDREEFGIGLDEYEKMKRGSSKTHAEIIYALAWGHLKAGDKPPSGYYSLALFAKNHGLDFMPARMEAARQEILGYRDQEFITRVSIVACENGTCNRCRKADGQSYKIEEALNSMPLPIKGCTCDDHFCICSYAPKVC